jgi:hypothetical protein
MVPTLPLPQIDERFFGRARPSPPRRIFLAASKAHGGERERERDLEAARSGKAPRHVRHTHSSIAGPQRNFCFCDLRVRTLFDLSVQALFYYPLFSLIFLDHLGRLYDEPNIIDLSLFLTMSDPPETTSPPSPPSPPPAPAAAEDNTDAEDNTEEDPPTATTSTTPVEAEAKPEPESECVVTPVAKASSPPAETSTDIAGVAATTSPSPVTTTTTSASTPNNTTTKKRLCRYPGCTRVIKSQGHCQRHGAKAKRCKVDGCDKQAQGTHEGMCKRHWKAIHFPDAAAGGTGNPQPPPPPPEGESVYDTILPQSISYRPTSVTTTSTDANNAVTSTENISVMPLVAFLKEGTQKETGWHRNGERRARGLYPVTSLAAQLEPWERQLVSTV